MARQLGLAAIELEKSRFRLVFPEGREISATDIQQMVEKISLQLEFSLDERLAIEVQVKGGDEQERLEKARDTLQEII